MHRHKANGEVGRAGPSSPHLGGVPRNQIATRSIDRKNIDLNRTVARQLLDMLRKREFQRFDLDPLLVAIEMAAAEQELRGHDDSALDPERRGSGADA